MRIEHGLTRARASRRAWLPLLLILLAGCGGKTSSVSGKVTFQGRPLEGGSVILYCEDKQIVRGLIGPDGTYTIPNVPKGVATVTVKAHAPIPAGFQLKQQLPPSKDGPRPPLTEKIAGEPDAVPECYGLPEESGLQVQVGPGRVVFDIDLRP
jgi:hypothetical protein